MIIYYAYKICMLRLNKINLKMSMGGVLPLEEFVFFLLTNTLVALGFVLVWSPESYVRFRGILSKLQPGKREVSLQQER